jgi:beta-glucuronidase
MIFKRGLSLMQTSRNKFIKKRATSLILLLILVISSFAILSSYLPLIDEDRFSPKGDDRIPLTSWKFKTDPNKDGMDEKWFEMDYEDSQWQDVLVPSTWNIEPALEWYKGFGWYRTHFFIPESWKASQSDELINVYFLAVFLKCDAWINGHYLGNHRGGYTDFYFDISSVVNYRGENILAVRVDNRLYNTQIPAKSFDWWFWGGLTREVFIEKRPRLQISDILISTKVLMNDLALINVTCTIINDYNYDLESNIQLKLVTDDILTYSSSFDISTNSKNYCQWSKTFFMSNPKLWSPENPDLYKAIVSVSVDNKVLHRVEERFGIREIKRTGNALYLNNRMIFLKGFSRHEDYPGYGNVLPYNIQYEDLKMIKESGANFVRLAHYPNHPVVLDICDELGLLVWEELPAWHISPEALSDSEIIEEWAKPQMREMIQRDKNHPCIIFWSIGNEFDTMSSPSLIYVRKMVNYTRSIDSSRLITYATNKYRGDLGYDYIDVISINAYMGWYTAEIDDFGKILDVIHKYNPDKPILISEFGAGAILGKRGAGKFTEDFQVTFLRGYWSQIEERMCGNSNNTGYIVGATWWVFADFKSPRRVSSPISKYNLKGVVDSLRRPKLAYFEISQLFNRMTASQSEIKLRNIVLLSSPNLFFEQLNLEKTLNLKIEILQRNIIEVSYTNQESMILNIITKTPLKNFDSNEIHSSIMRAKKAEN